ncbi:MAG: phosphatidylserine decarboxylase [Pseudomonadota bacterium]
MFSTVSETLFVPIHRDGWPFILISAVITFLLYAFGMPPLAGVMLLVSLWVIYFFRNPPRVVPKRDGLVVSPADGTVQSIIEKTAPPRELDLKGQDWTRVSIFLNIFDVHVNRIPIKGTLEQSRYHPGKFFNASLDKASEHNERHTIVIEVAPKTSVVCVQIAGLIARRIRCDVNQTDYVKTGQVYGLIRFGSRVDVYLPPGKSPLVCVGQKMIAGETVIADFQSKESPRMGKIR